MEEEEYIKTKSFSRMSKSEKVDNFNKQESKKTPIILEI